MFFRPLIRTCQRVAIILCGFIAVNFELAPRLPTLRLDLTEQQLYTLSPGTLQIIQEVAKPTDVYFYFSRQAARDLPVMRSYGVRIETLLREYERASNGMLRLHVIDPAPFSTDETHAQNLGMQAVPIGKGGAPVYFGLAIADTVDHHASIPFFTLDQQGFLEYDISRLVNSLSRAERPVIGLMSSLPLSGGFNVEAGRERQPWRIYTEIEKLFDVHELAQDVDSIPGEIKVLMLVHPKHLSTATLRGIDQFVLRGGRLLVFVDPYSEQDRGVYYFGIPSKDKSSDLTPLFKAWGIKLMPGYVLGDGRYGQYVSLAHSAETIWQPTALGLSPVAMNQEDVITAGLGSLNLTTAGVLSALPGATTNLRPLLHSSDQAMLYKAARLDHLEHPEELTNSFKADGERYLIAVRLQGPASSAFAEPPGAITQTEHINVVVVADTDVLSDNLWTEPQSRGSVSMPWADNSVLVLNAIDSLSGSDALISLRSRGRYRRTFSVVEKLQQRAGEHFRYMSRDLQTKLDETEAHLNTLVVAQQNNVTLTAEQEATLAQFRSEKVALEQKMRQVVRQLTVQVEQLGAQVKLFNIVLIPLLLSLVYFCAWLWRRR
ncbi:GldG family protein [Pseudomonas sp. DWP1b1]|uniref:GldG family protein n=1 Tax=unclassified Pseudomonas TaxID=196821 RepID=UPI003CF67613